MTDPTLPATALAIAITWLSVRRLRRERELWESM